MISKKLNDALNEQINKEVESAYLYQSMAAKTATLGFDGFTAWFQAQVKEELEHAKKMYNYIFERGGEVVLKTIEAPTTDWASVKEMFENTLEHEKSITKAINDLVNVAEEENDKAALFFLSWYLEEQVEEESNVETIISKFKNIGEDKIATYLLDREFASKDYSDSDE